MMEELSVEIQDTSMKIPAALLDNEIFDRVFSRKTYEGLSNEAKQKIMALLPTTSSQEETDKVLEHIFDASDSVSFYRPLRTFHERLKAGCFDPEQAKYHKEIDKCLKISREIKRREHYCKLLRTLLIRRRQIFQAAKMCRDDDIIKPKFIISKAMPKRAKIQLRALKRAKLILKSVKAEVKEPDLSSDDEDLKSVGVSSDELMPQIINPSKLRCSVTNESSYSPDDPQYSTLYDPKLIDFDMHDPIDAPDVKRLLIEYNNLVHSDQSDHPSLDFSDITIEGVTERTGILMSQLKPVVKKGHSASLPNVLMTGSKS